MRYMKYKTLLLVLLVGIISLVSSCGKDPVPDSPSTKGKLQLNFDFYNGGVPMEWGTKEYTNAAGNEYSAIYVKFFISRLTIYRGSEAIVLNKYHNSHYVGTDVASPLTWTVADDIEKGSYDSLSFTFGFNDDDNQSYMFVNPPESYMTWPDELGGGYHAMQLDGKWKLLNGQYSAFNFHLGRGQIYDTNGVITGFIDNSFVVSIPSSDFSISAENTTSLTLRMDIAKWFESPYVYDHNTFGGSIMENQDAMEKVVLNGWDVFSIIK